MKSTIKTEVVEYPCPNCGNYEKPYMHSKSGYAYMLCSRCNTQYKTSTKVSSNFRRFCSKIASKPNRSPTYYTPIERKVKEILDLSGFNEGIDYFHNARIKDEENKKYYWVDFILPRFNVVIEVSPKIWHKMWNRQESDEKKRKFLKSKGLYVLSYDEKDIDEWLTKVKRIEDKILDNLDSLSIRELERVLERTYQKCDDTWKKYFGLKLVLDRLKKRARTYTSKLNRIKYYIGRYKALHCPALRTIYRPTWRTRKRMKHYYCLVNYYEKIKSRILTEEQFMKYYARVFMDMAWKCYSCHKWNNKDLIKKLIITGI